MKQYVILLSVKQQGLCLVLPVQFGIFSKTPSLNRTKIDLFSKSHSRPVPCQRDFININYIGSSVNLNKRLREYLNINYLEQNLSMGICRALLKYGYSNFQFEILEYCECSKCLEREDYYLNLLNPEYNVSRKAGAPMYGRLHSEESKKKKYRKQLKKKGENHHFCIGRPKGAGKAAKMLEVFDIDTRVTTLYESISAAGRALSIPQRCIYTYFSRNQLKPYRGKYVFKKV
jgi:hypothetical protein